MKKSILFTLLCTMIACSPKLQSTETRLTLAPYQSECQGPFPQQCYVQILDNNEKVFFYEHIEGFEFEAGYEYTLLVEKKPRCNPETLINCPQDVGLYEYSLKEILSKKPSNATYEADFPQLEKTHDLSMYPKAKKGFKQVVIQLPPRNDESQYKVELFANVQGDIDCNHKTLLGEIKQKNLEGWGYHYYEFTGDGAVASTLAGCLNQKIQQGTISSLGYLFPYNSELPIVIYLKDNLNAHYDLWKKQ